MIDAPVEKQLDKLAWLQVLRALAACYVLLFHGRGLLATALPNVAWIDSIVRFGYMGVDIFFVLSGYVVGRSAMTIHSVSTSLQFLAKRLTRIYLGYWPVLALTLVGFAYAGIPIEREKAFTSLTLTGASIFNNWLHVAWSLAYEIYFYVLVAITFAALSQRLRGWLFVVFTFFLLCWHAGWWMLAPGAVVGGQEPLRFVLSAHVLEFLWGLLLAFTMRDLCARAAFIVCGGLLAALSVYNWVLLIKVAETGLFRSVTLGLVGLGLTIMCLGLQSTNIRPPRAAVALGDASYSLYLLHPLLLATFERMLSSAGAPALARLAVFPLIAVVSIVWFRAIEQPLYLHALDRFKLRREAWK